jgi:hypothetical protein
MNDSYVRTTNSSNKIRQSQRQKRQTAANSRGSTPELNNSNLVHRQRRTRVNSGYKQRKLSQSRLGSSINRNSNNKRGYTNRNNSLRRSPVGSRMIVRSNNSMTKRYSTRTKGVHKIK